MADWYVSSVAWTAIPQFAASTAYTVGNIIRPLTAPAFTAQYAFRCTTAGTSSTEPAWPAANNGTVTTGGATFTNVSGQSTYGWSAAAGTLAGFTAATNGRTLAGDRVFLSSDHSETATAGASWSFNNSTQGFGLIQIISVNRAGSVPPVAGDIANGAFIGNTGGNSIFEAYCNLYWQGVTFSGSADLRFNSNSYKEHYLKNCGLVMTSVSAANAIGPFSLAKLVLDNTTAQFGHVGQGIRPTSSGPFDLLWINTPSAIQGAIIPTQLFTVALGTVASLVTCRGVDLSAITGTLFGVTIATGGCLKGLLESCRIASGATRLAAPVVGQGAGDEVELVNCYDGTNIISERHTYAGDVTAEFTITLSGGAADDVGIFSHKMVSSARADKFAMRLDGFWMDVENTLTGSSHTATVEIISSASLNNDDIALYLAYGGTSGSSIASFADSFIATPVTTPAAVPTSSATWNSSPATPVKQHLQVTFTPQRAGRLRGQVRLGKLSSTVYVDPRITVT